MRKIRNIVILAGGDSTRFWPLSEKNLSIFLDKPLITYLVSNIKDYAENIIVVTSKTNKQLFDSLLEKKIKIIVQDRDKLGMAGAVLACKGEVNGEALILNASDIVDFKIMRQFVDHLDKQKSNMVLLAKKVDKYFPGGYLHLQDKKVIGIVEKPAADKTPSNLVKLTFDYFNDFKRFIDILESLSVITDDIYEKGLTKLISKDGGIDYIVYEDYWYTVKYPWHILQMMSFFLSTIIKSKNDQSVEISEKTKIIGPVYFGKNVKVGDFSKIVGPCYIGDDTVVADHCLIRESHVGKRCLIGSYTEIARSYLGNNVMLHQNYVGDSVFDNDVEMGARAVTANFRFDKKTVNSSVNSRKIDSNMIKLGAIIGQGSKLGVSTSILPGIKIGKNSLIGPGEVVTEDVKDNMFVFKGKATKNKF